jgi:aminomethyltransferase
VLDQLACATPNRHGFTREFTKEGQAMSQVKKTPFHEVGLEAGAKMVELFGYYLPWEYSPGHCEEHQGTRNRASLCDLHYMGEFLVEGPDAQKLIQKLCASDLSKKRTGSIKYTTFCNADGNMVDDGTVWRLAEDQYLIISGDDADYEWVVQNAANLDVRTRNVTNEQTTLALQGPKSTLVLKKLTEIDIDAIRYYNFDSGKVNGVECRVARMGYTGEFGYEIHVHPQHGPDMWRAIMQAGSDIDIVPLGQAGLESLRQEAGYLLVGNDHDKQTNPLEAGLGWTVEFEKSEFNGKQALERVRKSGVDRTLVWFRIPDGTAPKKGDPIYTDGKKVGEITSGSYSPTFKAGTGVGYVRIEHAMNGVVYSIKTDDGDCAARLFVAPLYDPGDVRTKTQPVELA